MSNLKGLLKNVPDTETSFVIEVLGNLSKHRYIGDFSCKVMTRGQRAMVQKHLALLNGELQDQLDLATLNFHTKIAYLKYALTETPKWWVEADYGYHLFDENVITEIYNKVIDFENNWLKEIWGDDLETLGKEDTPE